MILDDDDDDYDDDNDDDDDDDDDADDDDIYGDYDHTDDCSHAFICFLRALLPATARY